MPGQLVLRVMPIQWTLLFCLLWIFALVAIGLPLIIRSQATRSFAKRRDTLLREFLAGMEERQQQKLQNTLVNHCSLLNDRPPHPQ
jgi:hypothetical protein